MAFLFPGSHRAAYRAGAGTGESRSQAHYAVDEGAAPPSSRIHAAVRPEYLRRRRAGGRQGRQPALAGRLRAVPSCVRGRSGERRFKRDGAQDGLVRTGRRAGGQRSRGGARSLSAGERAYLEGIEACGEDALLRYNLGVLLADLGRREDAAAAYEAALRARPGFADCHYNLALLYEELERPREAIRHMARYRRLTGVQPD
jgi:tetratricopeptide (TPR) repeat protein